MENTLGGRPFVFVRGVVEDDEVLAWLLCIANNNAFTRKRPVIYRADVSDDFSGMFVEHIVINDTFAEQLDFAVFVSAQVTIKMVAEFRGFHEEQSGAFIGKEIRGIY
jgi:hypothetical protein